MNYWILLTLTFISVNLDFFFMLIFLLKRNELSKVVVGYLFGTIILLVVSYVVGRSLAVFLPEWILGILGLLPIYMAFNDNDEEDKIISNDSQVLNVMITYLSVCSGCNLSLFLPVLAGQTAVNFLLSLLFIGILTILVVFLVKFISDVPMISKVMEVYGEKLMKICYIFIGLYVLWDSGFIKHLIDLF